MAMSAGIGVKAGDNSQEVSVPEGALKALAANAIRHLIEANDHFKAGRYSSAQASVVLSIEESGKLGFLAGTGTTFTKGNRHAIHSILFVALLAVLEGLPQGSEWRPILRCEETPGDLNLTSRQQQTIAEHPEVAEFVRRVQAGDLPDKQGRLEAWSAAMVAKEQRDGTAKRWEPLITRGLQALRLNATYVDVNPSTGTWTDPGSVDVDLLKFLCTGAYGLLFIVLALTRHEHPTIELQEIAGGVPEGLIGADVVHGYVEKLNAAYTAEAAGRAA
jgi:AbiV